eukprot:scaffold3625_cov372-Prasinococcus_capsulatus_cf.AAC.2
MLLGRACLQASWRPRAVPLRLSPCRSAGASAAAFIPRAGGRCGVRRIGCAMPAAAACPTLGAPSRDGVVSLVRGTQAARPPLAWARARWHAHAYARARRVDLGWRSDHPSTCGGRGRGAVTMLRAASHGEFAAVANAEDAHDPSPAQEQRANTAGGERKRSSNLVRGSRPLAPIATYPVRGDAARGC